MTKKLTQALDRMITLVTPKAHAEATSAQGRCWGATCGGYGTFLSAHLDPQTADLKHLPCC